MKINQEKIKTFWPDWKGLLFFIFKNKKILLIAAFFTVIDGVARSLAYFLNYLKYPDLYGSFWGSLNNVIFSPLFYLEGELQVLWRVLKPINLLNDLSFFSALNLLGLGVIIAIFIFRKNIRAVYGENIFFKKAIKILFFLLVIFAFAAGVFYFLKIKFLTAIIFSAFIFTFQILFLFFNSFFEGALLRYLWISLSGKKEAAEEIFSFSAKILRPLFIFNIIITLIGSMVFGPLLYFIFGIFNGAFSLMPSAGVMDAVSLVLQIIFAIFCLGFAFVPAILAVRGGDNFFQALKDNFALIKKEKERYFLFFAAGILSLLAISFVIGSMVFIIESVVGGALFRPLLNYFIMPFLTSLVLFSFYAGLLRLAGEKNLAASSAEPQDENNG